MHAEESELSLRDERHFFSEVHLFGGLKIYVKEMAKMVNRY